MNLLTSMHWQWDISIIEFFNGWAQNSEFVATLFRLISYLGTEYAVIIFFGILYWAFDKEIARKMGPAVFFAMLCNNVTKSFFNRMRPYQQSPDTIKIKDPNILLEGANGDPILVHGHWGDYYASSSTSFPSGHSSGASALYNSYAIAKKEKIVWIIASVLCSLVMLSRMVLGAHFLTDVVAGYLLGFLVVQLYYFAESKIKNTKLLSICLIAVSGLITLLSPLWTDQSRDLFTAWGIYAAIVLGMMLENKYVNLENTKSIWKGIIRIALGVGIALLIKIVFKLPYKNLVQEGTYLCNLLDMLRYFIMAFVAVFLYPMLIKKIKFLNDTKKGEINESC